jgi:hypothetical protein
MSPVLPEELAAELLTPCSDAAAAASIAAATRLWLERAVIGLNLCPFAKAVHARRQIRYAVTAATTDRELLGELGHELDILVRADAQAIETTLLIHPGVLTDFVAYNRFLPRADAELRKRGLEGVVQIASFHPQYQFAGSLADDVENCTNRSPYPLLHLLREASIDRAVAAFPDAAAIYERNLETMRRLGHAGWQRLLAAAEPDA